MSKQTVEFELCHLSLTTNRLENAINSNRGKIIDREKARKEIAILRSCYDRLAKLNHFAKPRS